MFLQNFCLAVLLLSQIIDIWSDGATSELSTPSTVRLGHDADIKDANFVVSLRKKETPQHNPKVICAGSLISDNVVLTAAYCLLTNTTTWKFGVAKDYEVVMGNLDRTKFDENTLIFDIKKIVRGELSREVGHDIALLFLKDKVPSHHTTAKPVILSGGPLLNAEMCQAYGWGEIANDGNPDILQVSDLLVMTTTNCYKHDKNETVPKEGTFCGGYANTVSRVLLGDIGGPFVCNGVQVGIASFNNHIGFDWHPALFTEVAKYKRWISKHVYLNDATDPTFKNRSDKSIL